MMKKLFTTLFILLFAFCSKKSEHQLPRIITQEQKNVVEVNAKYMLHSDFEYPIACGFDKDTIVGKEIDFKAIEKQSSSSKKDNEIWLRYNFKINVDTSYTFPAKGFQYKNIPLPNIENKLINGRDDQDVSQYYSNLFNLEKKFVKCYPLLMFNNDGKSFFIHSVKLIQQAKDVDGRWKPIEFYRGFSGCIPNPFFYELKSKKYFALSIIKYNGDFKTKLRVKIQVNGYDYYSKEFNGSINRTQFDRTYAKKCLKIWLPDRDESFFNEYMKYVFLQHG